jgi:hypothetical protein
MKFGTVEYEANQPLFESKSKKKVVVKKNVRGNKFENLDPFSLPKVPSGWIKESLTGSSSLDQTSISINAQLKRTLVRLLILIKFLKSKLIKI